MSSSNDKQPGKREGIEESQQDRRQDDVARQRPGQTDQKIHDEQTRRPVRRDTPEP